MSNRMPCQNGFAWTETRKVRGRVGTNEEKIRRRVISAECARSHTGHSGVAREITARIPGADDSAGGQTCAACNASVRHTTAMHIRTKTREFEV